MASTVHLLKTLLADTYVLYTKTQSFHWHVQGPLFTLYHEIFEKQYQTLAEQIDLLAERIVMLGSPAPASLKQYLQLTSLQEYDNPLTEPAMMITALIADYEHLIASLHAIILSAQKTHDESTADLCIARLREHEKTLWMLRNLGTSV